MKIPELFKKTIADTFYDKQVLILDSHTALDEEGGFIEGALEQKGSFVGNVSFSNFKALKEQYGIEKQIDIVITTDCDKVQLADLISYKGIIYEITERIVSDSHIMVVGTKWE